MIYFIFKSLNLIKGKPKFTRWFIYARFYKLVSSIKNKNPICIPYTKTMPYRSTYDLWIITVNIDPYINTAATIVSTLGSDKHGDIGHSALKNNGTSSHSTFELNYFEWMWVLASVHVGSEHFCQTTLILKMRHWVLFDCIKIYL